MSRLASQVGPSEAWPAWLAAGQRRRLDPLARSACQVVDQLLGPDPGLDPETALVVSTSYGSVESTMRFIHSMATFADQGASPTPFTSSVHHASAGSLGELLGLHGPCTTLSQGNLGTLSALRWAYLMVQAQRAPMALVVIGDHHNDWSRRMVAELAGSPWPIGDGIAACLIEPGDQGGRELRLGVHPAKRSLDGGALLGDDESMLASRSLDQERLVAPGRLNAWWPCCLLNAISPDLWRDDQSIALREVEDGQVLEAWMGPWSGAPAVGP